MIARMLKRTPLHPAHVAAGARMVDFGGWDMPLHYGSQIEEHHAVRRTVGMFDVSHMRLAEFSGSGAQDLLRLLLGADVARRVPGQAMYTCMLDERGGILDDLIVYRARAAAGAVAFRAILNAAGAEPDLLWMRHQAQQHDLAARIHARTDWAIVAVQGPGASAALAVADPTLAELAQPLQPFFSAGRADAFVARTGYTGEDGFEIALPAELVQGLWQRLLGAGVRPCGLGARDTLRLEAGLCLHGQDIDATVTPLESGLAWTVDLQSDRAFIGREALERQRAAGALRQMLGLVLQERGVLRAHQAVLTRHGEGQITSGTFSPTLQVAIGLARLPPGVRAGDAVTAQLRGKAAAARVVGPRFVRHGAALV